MSDSSNGSSGGIGILGFMFLIFLTLKLTGHITWSWWWITSPLWGGLGLMIAIFVLIIIGALIFGRKSRR